MGCEMDVCVKFMLRYRELARELNEALKDGDEFSAKLYALLMADLKKLLVKYCKVDPSLL